MLSPFFYFYSKFIEILFIAKVASRSFDTLVADYPLPTLALFSSWIFFTKRSVQLAKNILSKNCLDEIQSHARLRRTGLLTGKRKSEF